MKLYKETRQYGLAAAICGALGMAAWLIPILGVLINVPAIFLGVYAVDNEDNGFAIAGITLGILGLVLTVIRSGLVVLNG